MTNARTEDVKRLYEAFPYPYGVGRTEPDVLLTYLFQSYFAQDILEGWRILEAGCGTGHKIAGLAAAYPRARFLGLELSERSVAAAQHLAQANQLLNLEITQGDILTYEPDEPFDVVQAFGVVHHLEDPQLGINRLSGMLKDDGIFSMWVYHPLGDFERLMQRELLLTLWGVQRDDMDTGKRLMQQLGLSLCPTHYGPLYGPDQGREASAVEANADAFMHPIVHAYRVAEVLQMMRHASLQWAAIDYFNLEGAISLIDLSDVRDPFTAAFCVRVEDLLPSLELQERFRSLVKAEQLKVIELVIRPRGFQLLAGRNQSYERLTPRIVGNVMRL